MRPVTILYEDTVGGPIKDYGPHNFVVQSAGDQLGKNRWEMSHVTAVPLNGNSNVREACKRERSRFERSGARVIAVYDSDQIGGLIKLAQPWCKLRIRSMLLEQCPWRANLTVVLLERNIETLLEAICSPDPSIVPEELKNKAIHHKKLDARDAILNRASQPAARGVRDAVRSIVPSFDYLIHKVVNASAEHLDHRES